MARSLRVLSPMTALRRDAIFKGLVGGSRGWMVVGAFVWGPRLLKKALGRKVQVVAIERLEPGQGLRIDAIKPPSRDERRTARRAR